jgi:hypothetical protein
MKESGFPFALQQGRGFSTEINPGLLPMKRLAVFALLSFALASCTTAGGGDPLTSRWKGKEAGEFFAAYGPPQDDASAGGASTYSWQGGYARRTVPAVYAEGTDGKKGKLVSKARTQSLTCAVEIKVDSAYRIASIRATIDREIGPDGKSYCAQFLDADGK